MWKISSLPECIVWKNFRHPIHSTEFCFLSLFHYFNRIWNVRSGLFSFSFVVLWLPCLTLGYMRPADKQDKWTSKLLQVNCFLIVISTLPSFHPNDLSTTFSIQLLMVLHYLHWNSTELFASSGNFTKKTLLEYWKK